MDWGEVMSKYGDEHEALAQLDTLLYDLEDPDFHPPQEMLEKLRDCIGILSGLIASAEELEAEVERLKKEVKYYMERFCDERGLELEDLPPFKPIRAAKFAAVREGMK